MTFTDVRQSREWGGFLSRIGWKIYRIQGRQLFLKRIPLLGYSVIKIQKPANPLPFSEINRFAKYYRALFIVVEPHFHQHHEIMFQNNGFKKTRILLSHSSTIHIDLTQSANSLWKSFSENARRNIKKSQAQKLIIKKIVLHDQKDDADFRKFYQLFKELAEFRKFYNPGYGEFYKKMLAFKKSSYLLFAFEGEIPIAVIWLMGYRKNIVYSHTGITQRGYRLLANYLLVWEGLKLAKKLGYRVFDFEGIYDPRFPWEKKRWINFSEFKKRFHGKLVQYPQPMIKIYNGWFWIIYQISRIFPP